jgi:hypothetical protein
MARQGFQHDLFEAMRETGCPVCRVLRESEARYWNFFLYEGFQDSQAYLDLVESVGYCPRHLAQLAARNDVFAAAGLASASVKGALRRLDVRPPRFRRRRIRRAGDRCPPCRLLATHEALLLRALSTLLEGDAEALRSYQGSEGLCFDHVAASYSLRLDELGVLVGHARARLRSRLEEVERLQASFDYQAAPATRELAGAWRRAFAAVRDHPGHVEEIG